MHKSLEPRYSRSDPRQHELVTRIIYGTNVLVAEHEQLSQRGLPDAGCSLKAVTGIAVS